MSKMTREEAHTILFNAINSLWGHDSMHSPDDATDNLTMRTTALSILAPEPRTEPSIDDFVREVERRAENNMMKTGKLEGAHYAAMKQYQAELSALPMPKGTDGTATFEKGEG